MNLFEMMGIELPAEEEVKKEVKKKEVKKESKVKNISLPVNVFVQAIGTIQITENDLEQSENVTDTDVLEYLISKYPYITKAATLQQEDKGIYIGYSSYKAKGGNIKLSANSKIAFGDFLLDLNELSGGEFDTSEAKAKDIAEYISNAGLPLGNSDKVHFLVENDIIIPIPENADNTAVAAMDFPVTVHMYGKGYDDLIVERGDDEELSLKLLQDKVAEKYPEAAKHCIFCAAKNNTICCYWSVTSSLQIAVGKKEEVYEVTDETVIRFYGTPVTIPVGKYTHKKMCKELAKNGIPECNTPDSIIIKKQNNLILLAVKYGGSKGAL